MANIIQYLFAGFCIIKLVNSQGTCPTGSWIKYKDEKCFQLVESFSNYADAKSTCISKGGILAIVSEEEQQLFLVDHIFIQGAVQVGVWIGATRKSNSDFEWENDTPVIYGNWAADSPTDLEGRDCVAMQSRYSTFSTSTINDIEGTWKDISCISPMYFVCERVPIWTGEQMRDVLIETRKKLDETRDLLNKTREALEETRGALEETKQNLEETRSHLDQTKDSLDTVVKNPVPIGFIYTQLPGQSEPSAIWPLVGWTEISSNFAGNFFRVVGGGAAAFGETQNSDSPRVIEVKNEMTHSQALGETVLTAPGSWSGVLVTGEEAHGGDNFGLKFLVNNVETRPVNTAVRIWVRQS